MFFIKKAIKNFPKRQFSKSKFCFLTHFDYQVKGVNVNTIDEKKDFLQVTMKLLEKNDFVISDQLLLKWFKFYESEDYKKPEEDDSLHLDAILMSLSAQISKNVGRLDLAKEQFLKSKDLFEQVKGEKDLPSILAIGYSATLYAEEKNYSMARDLLFYAAKYHPKDRILLTSLAVVYQHLFEFEKSEEVYKKLLTEFPHDSILLSDVAGFYSSTKDFKKAEKYYLKSLEILEDDEVLTNYGFMLFSDLGRIDESEEKFKRAIELNSNNYIAYSNLGTLYLSKTELDLAKENYLASLKIYQLQSTTLGQLGFLYHQQGKLDEAKKEYEKALDAESTNYHDTSLYLNYASLLMEREELDHADHIFRQGLDLDNRDLALLGNYASFFDLKRNDAEKAEEYFKKSIDVPNPLFYKSEAFRKNSLNYINFLTKYNRLEEANNLFKNFIQHFPTKDSYRLYAKFLRDHLKNEKEAKIYEHKY